MPKLTRLAWAGAMLPGLLAQLPAHADDETDTFRLSASQALRYDSNLFRRSSDERSETRSTTTAGVEFDKRYSLQRVELDANVAAHRYRANDYLDFNALNYRAVWHWSLTPRLRGTLARTRSEDINTFDYYRSFDRNVRTEHRTAGSAEAVLGRDWRLLGGVDRERRSNERPTAQDGDYTLRNLSAGVRWLFPSGSHISYRLLDGRGDYQNREPGVGFAPTAFEQREHELRLSWSVTEKTTLDARLAHLEREHPGLPERDFSGPRGNLSLQWSATAQVGVQLMLARELSAYQTNTASYATNNRIALNPYWTLSARTTLYAGIDHGRYAFGGALPGSVDEDREDRTNGAVLGVRWKPLDALSLRASLARERRSSNVEGFSYTNNAARVDATFAF
ncbi:XrtB/PEP-CTERM-associated polysaccharide biosynthesis outer membrane protein EpsL [Pseudorhodoferax sp.]|uniref:XrtB/PEP-CTERM-associated polysaccharide biosynthesis outer membrane protein EpsL n=1 Tax=Pseudorhodoferax sp. TaxID=1993553 RepID=UPI002DD69C14|nr:XrtB/PEP-CTERM-associated polysaccharide biosynthesis outer membrane protein EpsL [Pseudorhodoferax sp.]